MSNELDIYPPRGTTCAWWGDEDAHRIFTVVNTPGSEAVGTALLLPPFGQHLHRLFTPAVCLNEAGVRTVRFDGRNNEGASEGKILDYKLSLLLEDARVAAKKIVETFGRDDFAIFGVSMSAAVAMLLAQEFPRARVFLLVPIIDMARMVNLVSNDRRAADAYRTRSLDAVPVRHVLGHDVRLQNFYRDAIAMGVGTAEDVLSLARSVRGRVDLVLAENDHYATPELQQNLIEALDAGDTTLMLEQMGHDMDGSPVGYKRSFTHLVQSAQSFFGVPEEGRSDPIPPDATRLAGAKIDRAAILDFFNGRKGGSASSEGDLQPSSGLVH